MGATQAGDGFSRQDSSVAGDEGHASQSKEQGRCCKGSDRSRDLRGGSGRGSVSWVPAVILRGPEGPLTGTGLDSPGQPGSARVILAAAGGPPGRPVICSPALAGRCLRSTLD